VGKPGPVLLGLSSISPNGGFRRTNFETYGGDCAKNIVVNPGDIYVSLKDVTQSADLLGAVARLPKDISSGRLTQDTVRLIAIRKDTPWDYIYWLLRTPQYRNFCSRYATGTTTLGLGRDDFLGYPVPDFTDQRRFIVQALEAIERRHEELSFQSETLESLARAIFKSWFVDFDPVRAKAEGREPDGMDADAVALFPSEFVESSLGSLPISYFISDLQSECAISMGQSPPGSTYNECVEGLPFFQGRADFKTMFPKRRIYCSEPSRFASAGDVLLSVRAPVGDINIALDDCAIGRGVASIRHKSGSTAYSWCLLKSLKASFDSFDTEGTVFGAINGKDLKALKTVVPPAAIVESFASLFDPVFSKLKLNELEARTLADLRDTLLPRLISGKLRVPEVEAMLTGGCREV
jgi:restriction endonuclease S subunit